MTDDTKLPARFPATQAVHPDWRIPPGFGALSPATHRASTVVFKNLADLRAFGSGTVVHWRYGLHATPTSDALCQALAQIEGGQRALLLPSGLGAISLVYFTFLRPGDDVLVPTNAYGPNQDHGAWMARQFGISARPYDPMIGAGIAGLMRPNTKLVWLESPGSVTMEIPDSAAIAREARAAGALTAIDNTWSGGLYYQPFAQGIDISVQALTKYQSGGSDVLMGAAITRDETLHRKLLMTRMRMGWGVSADDCFLVLRSLPSLPARLAAHDAHAREVAQWLAHRPEVARVLHPALPDCPGHAHWTRDFTGAGGLFSIMLHERYAPAQIDAFIEALRYFAIGFSWGGAHSLALPCNVPPAHAAFAAWARAGGLVRLYIGLEDPRDLIADLQQAMQAHLPA